MNEGPEVNGDAYGWYPFDYNLYDKIIKVSFLSKIREEKKFDSIESLKVQLEVDKEFCYELEKNI